MKPRVTPLLPLVLMAFLGLLTLWLQYAVLEGFGGDAKPPGHDPDSIVVADEYARDGPSLGQQAQRDVVAADVHRRRRAVERALNLRAGRVTSRVNDSSP